MFEISPRLPGTRSATSALAAVIVLTVAALLVPTPLAAQPFDGYAIYGQGGAGYSQIPNAPALNPSSAITLEAWVDADSDIADCASIVGKGYFTSYWLGFCEGGLRSWLGGEPVTSPVVTPTNRYVHVAVTSNGVRRRHYFDGALILDVPEPAASFPATVNPVQIGDDANWSVPFKGVIDEVRLWNVARTGDQIRDFKDKAIDVDQPGLVAVWSFGPNDTFDNFDGVIVGSVFGLAVPPPGCWDTTTQACLGDRFVVTAVWASLTDSGTAVNAPAGSDDTAIFSFFDPDNWELLVKVLDACAINNRYWVFLAASTDQEYTVTVRDNLTGAEAVYANPLGTASPAVTDINALPVCIGP
jgi:hypothetical protein